MTKYNLRKKGLISLEVVIAILLLLLVIRIVLPYAGKYVINNNLGQSLEAYEAHISDLSLKIYAGQYVIEDLIVKKKGVSSEKPFLQINRLAVNVSWRMLLDESRFVLNAYVDGGHIQLIDSDKPEEKQLALKDETAQHWSQALKAVIPLSIAFLDVKNFVAEFQNQSVPGLQKNRIAVEALTVEHLLDPKNGKDELSAVTLKAMVNEHAALTAKGGIDLTKEEPQFEVGAQLKDFKLTSVNKLLLHYVPLDLNSGTLNLIAEIHGSMEDGDGYTRVYLENLDILKFNEDFESGENFLVEFAGSFANWILDAITDGRVATEIPFKLKKKELEVDGSTAFWKSLENSWDKIPKTYKSKAFQTKTEKSD